MRAWIGALLFWTLCSAPALAQGTEEEPTAAPGSLGIALIEDVDGFDIFENLPSAQIVIRHTASGLTCRFALDDANRLYVFPGLPRGDDVGCNSTADGVTVTFYATRYPEPTNVADKLSDAIAEIEDRFASISVYEPPAETKPLPGYYPPSQTARFRIRTDQGEAYTRVSVAMINGWVIKMRFSMYAKDDKAFEEADIRATMEWFAALAELVAQPNL